MVSFGARAKPSILLGYFFTQFQPVQGALAGYVRSVFMAGMIFSISSRIKSGFSHKTAYIPP
jgi:hypothetical protein